MAKKMGYENDELFISGSLVLLDVQFTLRSKLMLTLRNEVSIEILLVIR